MEKVIYSNKVKKDLLIDLYSDLHYNPGDNLDFFKKNLEKLAYNDYTFFLGDLIHDSKYELKELKELLQVIAQITKYTKLIFILGNHDQFTRSNNEWVDFYNKELVNELKNIGVILLQNEYYKDDNINVYGARFDGSYYEKQEPIDEFINNIKNVEFTDLDKFNILLEHSPKNTFNKDIISNMINLNNLDLVLAGHYHNGCIPWYISNIIKGNSGIIDPYSNLFPKYARNDKNITETTYGNIIAPIRTFSSKSILNIINNVFFPSVNQKILIKKI